MQKLSFQQQLSQKLSPQQIQFIKLLQIPAAELESRIEEELEINPALEEGKEEQTDDKETSDDEQSDSDSDSEDDYNDDELNLEDYIGDEDIAGYKMQGDGPSQDEDEFESPLAGTTSLSEILMNQLGFLRLNEHQQKIAEQLIGSVDEDGYIRRNLDLIVDDLAFSQNIETTTEEIEEVLYRIQEFDPAGIGARDLQECLLIQLERKDMDEPDVLLAHHIIKDCFEEFTKKHYDKIQKKYDVDDASIKSAINIITKLNPKPGGNSGDDIKTQYLLPDFILQSNNGELELSLNSKNAPDLRVSRNYTEMFQTYDKSAKNDKKLKEAVTFVKQKLDAAKWFIEAIKQRQQTLLRTMHAILEFQKEFFFEGDETHLKPMILKDIADMVGMDISTISRVANSKAVQTEFGIYPLKYFFSEGIATDSGEDASSREVKHILKEIIDGEEKKKPLSDEKLEKELNKRGYNIARRTVAKYREQLNIPVARLRKEL
ncbi:RNA polymerase factor sigma-54 [uncultured Cytophaga sp.]|uniref:RNA polymerase factor sigma-54 n=1 Tax=uncultured Cytophaga sp. TaxID=160238 RepID=UPI0026291125|nr:RNA polymerase factor sigma-54 [uncultured Cytophaga sp.]